MLFKEANAKRPQIDAVVAEVLAEFSPDVVELQYKIGLDWTDEWSVFFSAVLSDEAADPKNLRGLVPRIVFGIADKLPLSTFEMFPYVVFQSVSEQAESKTPALA
jgi:hypothetical protein